MAADPNAAFERGAVLRLVQEYAGVNDAPSNAVEFRHAAACLTRTFTHMNLKQPRKDELYAMMLQQAPFTWDLLSELCREAPLDVCRNAWTPPAFKVTTGYVQLDPHMPRELLHCCVTGEPCSEGFVAIKAGESPKVVSPEACIDTLADGVPALLKDHAFWHPQHATAQTKVHELALANLIQQTHGRKTPVEPESLVGSFVDVNTEGADGEVLVETMLVTEYDVKRGNIFGYWLYDLSSVAKDQPEPEDSMDTEAFDEDGQLLLSDHFDTINVNTLAEHCEGPRALEFEDVAKSIVGAWSSKHTVLFHGVHRVRTFIEMCGICNELGYQNAGLKLWPKLQRRVSAILPSGTDGSLQRAQDLCDEMWKGVDVFRMKYNTLGTCDCCGLQRTLSHTLNEEWYIGSACAAKISSLKSEVSAAKAMCVPPHAPLSRWCAHPVNRYDNPAEVFNVFTYSLD